MSLPGIEMNGLHQDSKNQNFEQVFPGCLGRMVNLFELNVGVSPNRLLTDKPHRDGSPLSRSRSDGARMSPTGHQLDEKLIVSDLRSTFSNRKSNGTPMKMFIAQEMSKEVDPRRSPSNLVAKLMGLDTLPHQEANSINQPNIPMNHWEQHNGFSHYIEPNKNRNLNETPHDKRMALVRQNFVEAKRLSMDEKLRQSKQFQESLEVLNSNKDLFLKCLQEPNSMFSHNLPHAQQPFPPHPETKRITVLRPSKMVESNKTSVNRDGKELKEGAFESSPPATFKNYENPIEPTRIVVLKPSFAEQNNSKPLDFAPSVPPGNFFEDDENQEAREVAKAITDQMRDQFARHRRDETLISSVFSNGYVGDESSFNKSEIECPNGILSDSEAISPVSRHSWDYCVNSLGSPYSSFSRASYSPDSSVCREAKKRLSERFSMMASNGSCQEQRHVQRRSSTLGEMLALSANKATTPGEEGSSSKESNSLNTLPVSEDNLPRNLVRSKSTPVSSKDNIGISVPVEEETKERSVKSSFKGKVSSLFFSRNKKTGIDKSLPVENEDEFRSSGNGGEQSGCDRNEGLDEKKNRNSSESGLSMEKPIPCGNLVENQDQPSPISVLEPPFEEDDRQGVELPVNHIRSNLIDKSPPIGSIARTLSYHPKESLTVQETDNDGQEWFFLVKTLLSVAGVQGNKVMRWHSSESPLDPSLRDKYVDLKDKYTLHEAKRRQKRSTRKLVFDCVNAVLNDISCNGLGFGESERERENDSLFEDEVWARMNVWFSSEFKCVSDDCEVVEGVVRREVAREGWIGNLRVERDCLVREIERKLMEELVQEAVVELTGRA